MQNKTIHFIGIGGASMSALAYYFYLNNFVVQGSDISKSNNCKNLEKLGVKIFYEHNENNVKNADICVYNCAINQDNPEFVYAQKNNIKIISRAELLASVCKDFKNVICVAGAHGKTSTCAMLFSVLKNANLNPSLHIGANIEGYDFNFVMGDKNYIICEACEFMDSFLSLKPDYSVILNIEKEHLDYFKTFDNIKKSFQKFANSSKFLICDDNCGINHLNKQVFSKTIFGYNARNIKIADNKIVFDCYNKNEFLFTVKLNSICYHNIQNSLAVIALCLKLDINKKHILAGLKSYIGVKRRMEIVEKNKCFLLHDYAHHPTEIKSVLRSIANIKQNKKVVVVFQPHTYSRTKLLFDDFVDCLQMCDELVILKTYSAREKFDEAGDAKTLFQRISKQKHCRYYEDFKIAKSNVVQFLNPKNIVVCLGAGDIDIFCYNLCK